MPPQLITQQNYQQLAQNQDILMQEVRQLKMKLEILSSRGRFNRAAKKLQAFAKKKGITKADVLKDD